MTCAAQSDSRIRRRCCFCSYADTKLKAKQYIPPSLLGSSWSHMAARPVARRMTAARTNLAIVAYLRQMRPSRFVTHHKRDDVNRVPRFVSP